MDAVLKRAGRRTGRNQGSNLPATAPGGLPLRQRNADTAPCGAPALAAAEKEHTTVAPRSGAPERAPTGADAAKIGGAHGKPGEDDASQNPEAAPAASPTDVKDSTPGDDVGGLESRNIWDVPGWDSEGSDGGWDDAEEEDPGGVDWSADGVANQASGNAGHADGEGDDGHDWEETGAQLAGADGSFDIELGRPSQEGVGNASGQAAEKAQTLAPPVQQKPRGVNKWDRTYARMLHQACDCAAVLFQSHPGLLSVEIMLVHHDGV